MTSVISIQSLKGKIYPSSIWPKGEVEALRFTKCKLEELTVAYDFIKKNMY